MSDQRKQATLNELNATYSQLTNAKLRLEFAGKNDEADEVSGSAEKVRQEIDRLRGEVADRWTDDTQALIQEIRDCNSTVEGYIQEIQSDIQTAQNVVKLVGAVDDIIGRVKQVIP
jgi:hypothetical protein